MLIHPEPLPLSRHLAVFAILPVLLALAPASVAYAADGAAPPAGSSAAASTGSSPGAVAVAPAAAAAPGGRGARALYLVRHGEYDSADPTDPAVGKALLPIGVAQARLLGSRLRGLPRFDGIRASPLTRARQTAEVLADDLGMVVRIDPLLEECTPPTWRADVMAGETPGALTGCRQRLETLAADVLTPAPTASDRRDLLVAHGNVIRFLVVRALGVDPESWLGLSIGHASLTVLTVDPRGTARVLAVGDVGHLPPNLQTGSAADPPRSLAVPTP